MPRFSAGKASAAFQMVRSCESDSANTWPWSGEAGGCQPLPCSSGLLREKWAQLNLGAGAALPRDRRPCVRSDAAVSSIRVKQNANSLLPFCYPTWYRTAHEQPRGRDSQKDRPCSAYAVTGWHSDDRISSAVHSTTLPPLREAKKAQVVPRYLAVGGHGNKRYGKTAQAGYSRLAPRRRSALTARGRAYGQANRARRRAARWRSTISPIATRIRSRASSRRNRCRFANRSRR